MINFFKTILYYPLYNLLIFFVWLVPGNSIGWAIILITIFIRLILLPSSIKASKAQLKLQMLQPEMNRIKREIKDQQAQGKALMELYKREGASPFGSCLPLLIQLPIIFVLYQVFRISLDTSHFNFLYSFTPRPEAINPAFFGIDLSKPELWLFPILAGASQFLLSKMMMVTQPVVKDKDGKTQADPMQMMNKQMIYIFPLMTLFIARSLPAALSLYWIVTTVFGIAQQYYVNKVIKNKPEFVAEVKEDEKAIEEEIDQIEEEEGIKPPKKDDFMTKIMKRKLDKQEKKSGVEVTIRTKK